MELCLVSQPSKSTSFFESLSSSPDPRLQKCSVRLSKKGQKEKEEEKKGIKTAAPVITLHMDQLADYFGQLVACHETTAAPIVTVDPTFVIVSLPPRWAHMVQARGDNKITPTPVCLSVCVCVIEGLNFFRTLLPPTNGAKQWSVKRLEGEWKGTRKGHW